MLSGDDRARLIGSLATNPQAGDLIPALGGIRKLRFARLIYGKSEQDEITPQQRDALLALLKAEKPKRRAR